MGYQKKRKLIRKRGSIQGRILDIKGDDGDETEVRNSSTIFELLADATSAEEGLSIIANMERIDWLETEGVPVLWFRLTSLLQISSEAVQHLTLCTMAHLIEIDPRFLPLVEFESIMRVLKEHSGVKPIGI